MTRFDFVEGLSGSAFGDVLTGDDSDALTLPTAGARGSVLNNISLIAGLQDLLGVGVTSFSGGNIILGGGGSDRIMGRAGDDIIDGNAWLNVRISVRQNPDGTGPELASFDSMEPLVPLMLSGEYTPGQLRVVREIKFQQGGEIDTAVFRGNFADYTVVIDDNGTAALADDVVVVTDNVAGRDGIDTLTHMERLQFADGTMILGGNNDEATGSLAVVDAVTNTADGTPALGQVLKASIAGVTDGDNVSPTNPTGAITGPVSYFWQVDLTATGLFTDILVPFGGGVMRAEGPTFTPTAAEVGFPLRVRAVYKDANGTLEEVFSAPTAIVDVTPSAPKITSIAENAGGGISGAEASDGTLVVVNLTGTGAVGGNVLTINWDGFSTTMVLTPAQVAANTATVLVPAGTIAAHGDGAFNVTARLSNAAGNEGPHSAPFRVKVDTTADAAPTATLAINDPLISAADVGSVSYTVNGLDADADAVVTFTVGAANFIVNVTTNGTFSIDLSSLPPGAFGTLTTSLEITDALGNVTVVAGGQSTVATGSTIAVTVAQYFALGAAQLADYSTVVLADTGANLAALSVTQIAALAGNGVDIIDATDDILSLNVARYLALGTVSLTAGDFVTLVNGGAALAGLSAAQFAALAGNGIDRVDSTTNALSLTVAQYLALGTVALTAADVVTLADTGANLASLSAAQFAALAGNGIDRIDATDNALSLSVAQYLALGTVTLTVADVVTLADTGPNLAGLSAAQIAGLAGKRVDTINATDDTLSLSVAQYLALGPVTLTAADTVTLADTGANLAALSSAQISALAGKRIDRIDATDDALTLSRAQFGGLGNVLVEQSDALTVLGTGGNDSFSFTTQTFTANDSLVGGAGTDILSLRGDYSAGLVFGAAALSGIDRISLLPNGDYDLTTVDANVGSGQALAIIGNTLAAGDSLIFDGSAETDGRFLFRGGAGSNSFTGGNQADNAFAGSGVDTFAYTSAGQSTSTTHDTVTGFNFAQDRFDVAGSVTAVQTAGGTLNNGPTFDAGLAAGLGGLGSNEAALFTATGGTLNGVTLLVVDQNGLAGYQAGGDLVVRLSASTNALSFGTSNFI
jgi:hypothetical protein